MGDDTEDLLVERDGHVVTLTLNRPEAKNSFSANMLGHLAEAWEMVDGDDDVRAVILTGAGGDFCAGADLKMLDANPTPGDEYARRFEEDASVAWEALLRSRRLSKPLIAAVEGYAVAGGTEILQTTDVRIAGESATFGVTEVTRGLFPLGGSTVRLQRQIPYTLAMEILLTGRHVSAQEAREIGLIGRVVPDGTALETAREVAAQIASNGPLAVQAVKRSVQQSATLPEDEALDVELEIGMPVFATEDAKEGPRAFKENRQPDFRGR